MGKDVYIFRLRKGCKDRIIFEFENGTLIFLARVYVVDVTIVLILFVYILSNSFKTAVYTDYIAILRLCIELHYIEL